MSVCSNHPTVFAKAARSIVEIGWGNRVADAKRLHAFETIDFQWQALGARVDVLRNQAAMDALSIGASYLLFLDADMVFPQDLLPVIFRHASPQQIVGGLYTLKAEPFAPVALVDEELVGDVYQFHHVIVEPDDAVLRQVDVLGMGCTLIPTWLFTVLPRPWFRYRDDAQGEPRVSEDVPFCQAARSVGVTLFLDPTIRCGHLGVREHDVEWALEYQRQVSRMAERLPVVVRRI